MSAKSPAHARGLHGGQLALAVAFVVLGLGLIPVAFVVMLLTVMHLLGPTFGGLAWAVPVGTELGFLGFFAADLLCEWRRRPLKILRVAPWVFAAASLSLNVLAAHGMADAIGHAVLPMVFFGYILAAEVLTRRMAVTDEERALEVAMADATAHARDLLRDRLGPAWKLRCGSLLRRQIRSGRATAAVRSAAENAVRHGEHEALEAAVDKWIVAGLTRSAKVNAEVDAVKRAASLPPSPASGEALAVTPGKRPSPAARKRKASGGALTIDSQAQALAIVLSEPDITGSELGRRLGLSPSRGRAILQSVRRRDDVPDNTGPMPVVSGRAQ